MDREIGEQILRRLDAMLALMIHVVSADKSQVEKIHLLHSAGFQPKEIAQFIGTTANTVRVSLSLARKEGRHVSKRTKRS